MDGQKRRAAPVTASGAAGGAQAKAAKVYGSLREGILSMQLEPGAFLDEIRIADKYNVSRSPVREALIRLTADGLVSSLHNRVAVVKPLDLASFPQYMDALTLVQRAVTRLAALHRTGEDLARIAAMQEIFEKNRLHCDAPAMIDSNRDLHLAISAAGGNAYLHEIYGRLLDDGRRILRVFFRFFRDELPKKYSDEHKRIIRAIERGDPDEAERLAGMHARGVSEQFIRNIRQRDSDDAAAKLPSEAGSAPG